MYAHTYCTLIIKIVAPLNDDGKEDEKKTKDNDTFIYIIYIINMIISHLICRNNNQQQQ